MDSSSFATSAGRGSLTECVQKPCWHLGGALSVGRQDRVSATPTVRSHAYPNDPPRCVGRIFLDVTCRPRSRQHQLVPGGCAGSALLRGRPRSLPVAAGLHRRGTDGLVVDSSDIEVSRRRGRAKAESARCDRLWYACCFGTPQVNAGAAATHGVRESAPRPTGIQL